MKIKRRRGMNKIAEISFGERVLAILALVSKNYGLKEFFYDYIFYGINNLTKKYPEAFSNIYFRYLVGGVPYCQALENVLFRLGVWGGVYLTGRKYQYITVNFDIVKNIEEDIKNRYTKEKLEELIKMSRDFADFVEKKQKRIYEIV